LPRRIAPVSNLAGCARFERDFIYTNGLKRGVRDTATYVVCENNPLFFKAACKNSVNCAFRVKVRSYITCMHAVSCLSKLDITIIIF